MEEKGEKINCECGSVVLKKNLSSHVKTKKHQALAGPSSSSLHRSTGVSFADAQHTDRADMDDEGSDDDDGEDMEELFDMIEELGKAIVIIDQKIDSVVNSLANLLNVVQHTRNLEMSQK